MERDFLGLSSSEASGVVKTEEISSELCRDSGLNKVLGTKWPLLDKFYAVPDLKQELPGGVVVATPNSGLLGAASTLGTTEPRKVVKSYRPSQLTIFYAGTVVVYDDIPPEKVQAIMFLAGNGTSKSPKTSYSGCYIQAPTPGNVIGNNMVLKQPTTWPCSSLLGPLSVVSHSAPSLGSGPTKMEKVNTEGVAVPSKVDSPKMVGAMRSISVATMISAAIPQVPNASLARFLEKRKERVRSAAPYSLSKISSLECATAPASPPVP